MKIRYRIEIANHILYLVFDKVELVSGICSRIGMKEGEILSNEEIQNSLHYPLFDYDHTTLLEVKYHMSEYRMILNKPIYIMSDKEGSYRVICTNKIEWTTYIRLMLNELMNGLDYQFFRWSIIRGYATVRLTNKTGRPNNKIVAILNYDGDNSIIFNGKDVTIESYQADKDGMKVDLKW